MQSTVPLVSIIVVNFNGKKYLDECFGSLLKLKYPQERIELIMIDNGSTDGSLEFVEKVFPTVKVVKSDVNNYARANNLGIQNAQGQYIGFANNDIKLDENWLSELLGVIEKEDRVGAVGGKILFENGLIQSVGLEEYPDFYWGDRGFKQEDKGQYGKMEEVKGFGGSAVIYKKACLDEVGVFDEDFQMYMEDVDIGLRCAQKKWKIMYVPTALAWHHFRGTSTPESVEYFSERNRLLLVAKHYSDQLSHALYGKGYFTASDKSIYGVLPLILGKLIECHGGGGLRTVLSSVCESLGNISNLAHRILMDRVEEYSNIIAKKEIPLGEEEKIISELIHTNSTLRRQNEYYLKTVEAKEDDVRQKSMMLEEENKRIAQLQGKFKEVSKECEIKQDQLSAMERDLKKKDISLQEQTKSNAQLQGQFKEVSRECEVKQNQFLAMDRDFKEMSQEVASTRADLERIVRFDQKVKILLIKPQRVSVEKTQEAARVIKRKYPNAAVYVFANLLKEDYERMSKSDDIEKSLMFGSNGTRPIFRIPRLLKGLYGTRFDMAVSLLSRGNDENYKGYRRAKLLGMLVNSKSVCNYYID